MATSSYTWTSSAAAKINEFSRIQTNARHLGFTKNPHFPKTVAEYAQHQADFKHDMAVEEREKLSYKIEASVARKKGVQAIGELMGGLRLGKQEMEKVKKAGLFTLTSASTRNKFSVDKGKGQKEEQINDGEGGYCKKEDKKFYKTGYSKVLGLRTDIWAGNEEELTEGKRKHNWDQQRAYWPENAEFRAEGIGRLDAALPRRLPRPRIDSFNKEALFHHLGDTELTFEEMTNRVRQLTAWSKDNLAIWKRQTVDFQAELDVLRSIERERSEDDMLIEALGIETVSTHGSLAAAVDAQAKLYGLSKKGYGTGWRPSGAKIGKGGMARGIFVGSTTTLAGSPFGGNRFGIKNASDSNFHPSSNTFNTSNGRGISAHQKMSSGDAIAFPDPRTAAKLDRNTNTDPPSTLYGSEVDGKGNGAPSIGTGIDHDISAKLFTTKTSSRPLNPASHYNPITNLSHARKPINNASVTTSSGTINPSQKHNLTTHPTPKGHNSSNGLANFPPSSSSIDTKSLAPALTNINYPNNKAYGADGNGNGKVPSEEGWVFDEEYLRERGWGGLLDELDRGLGR